MKLSVETAIVFGIIVILFIKITMDMSWGIAQVPKCNTPLRSNQNIGSSLQLKAKKKVLFVIDMLDGYDAEFLKSVECGDEPGCLEYIMDEHEIKNVYKLDGRTPVEDKPEIPEEEWKQRDDISKSITYDKGWNKGLNGDDFERISNNIATHINSGDYDVIVFTFDYLEPDTDVYPDMNERGTFPLNNQSWGDKNKPITLVPFGEYLTLQAGGKGTEISRRIIEKVPGVTNRTNPNSEFTSSHWGEIIVKEKMIPTLYISKQVDNAFNTETETSVRTDNKTLLDSIDVTKFGAPNPNGKLLIDWLREYGINPDTHSLHFTGILTDRCVRKSAVAARQNSYDTYFIENATGAANTNDHEEGIAEMQKNFVKME